MCRIIYQFQLIIQHVSFNMKNNIIFSLLAIILLATTSLSAQRKFAGGVGLGASKLTGDLGKGGSFGLNYYVEAKYFITEKITGGIEYNSAAVGYANEEALLGVSFYGNTSFFAKGEYFLTKSKVRPYVGLGLGVAKLSTPELSGTDANGASVVLVPEESKFNLGVSPRIGLMIKNFGIEFAYNIAGKTPNSTTFNVATNNKPFNFYSINLKYSYPFEL
jgi:hypothetical protein